MITLANKMRCTVSKVLGGSGHLSVVRLEPLPDEGPVDTRLLVESPIGNAEIGHALLRDQAFEVGKIYAIVITEVPQG